MWGGGTQLLCSEKHLGLGGEEGEGGEGGEKRKLNTNI